MKLTERDLKLAGIKEAEKGSLFNHDKYSQGKAYEIEISEIQAQLIRDALEGKSVDKEEAAMIADMLGDLQDGALNSFVS